MANSKETCSFRKKLNGPTSVEPLNLEAMLKTHPLIRMNNSYRLPHVHWLRITRSSPLIFSHTLRNTITSKS
jgi:hypothetical protein